MKFQQWVKKKGGAAKVSRLVGLSDSAAAAWVARRANPHPTVILKLVAISGGRLTFPSVVRDTLPRKKRKVTKKKTAKKKSRRPSRRAKKK